MQINVNGKPMSYTAGLSVSDLLAHLSLPPGQVVVEVNNCILEPGDYQDTRLSAGDAIELIQFVGGG
ncbi:MAG: sulfur carrier protein ThiS [Pelovirga sp.]